ncbi:MAG: glycoside hydrolase family 13 protein [Clostridia bacterium]|nr:glycoside hydrolase family 13 protein [Clostridia bacterium]
MRVFHDPASSEYRCPGGAVATGTAVFLRFRVEECADPARLSLTLTRKFREEVSEISVEGAPECGSAYGFRIGEDVLSAPGVYFYGLRCGEEMTGNIDRITVYEPGLKAPGWFKNAVIYQIFPDRFAVSEDPRVVPKENSFTYASVNDKPEYLKDADGEVVRWDFYGGNLKGIEDNLSYVESLGADTVYLNPVFEAASNHRYDTGDYEHIDGLLGGDAAFSELVQAMNSRNMRLILDGVFSHTGRRSRYFEAAQRGEAPYAGWYTFRDDGTYVCWWDVADLPCVKELEPSYLEYTVTGRDSIVRRWLRAGASGWRLDVADELPDEFLEALLKAATEEKPDAAVFGEVWEDGTDKVSYGIHRSYFTKRELHSQTNYPFRERLLKFLEGSMSAWQISGLFREDSIHYPPEVYYSLVNMTGTHDVERLFTYLKRITRGDVRLASGLLKAYSLVQFCFPGVPLIYYGDEICMEGGTDPDNRRFFDWSRAGGNTCAWFSGLSELRRSEEALRGGSISFIDAGDNIFAFSRAGNNGKYFLCAVDRFGRGPEFILDRLEENRSNIKPSLDFPDNFRYNIVKQADGYAILLEIV